MWNCYYNEEIIDKNMEETEKKVIKELNGLNISISTENITTLDLSHRNINNIEHVKLPPNLIELNISHNKLDSILEIVINQKNLKVLDVSYNNIQYFDDTPNFCHVIESLNISNNQLYGPPAWVWFEHPKNLTKLDISSNVLITKSFQNGYFEELIQHKTFITDITIYSCKLQLYKELLGTFPKAKTVVVGCNDISYLGVNSFTDFPCEGLTKCCDIERLILSFTQIFNIKPNIDIYKHLIEINLSHNEISSLPDEFCNLECLEVCILSFNHILYLPEDFVKLRKLVTLSLENNELCMLPENLCYLPNLKKLDLYDNYLCELPVGMTRLLEIDLAQNYVEEPIDKEYVDKRDKLRLHMVGRSSGRYLEFFFTGQ